MEEPDIDVTIEEIRKRIAKEKEQRREPANLGEDEDPDPPAAAEGQGTDSEDEGVCATCGLREPDTGGTGVID